MLKLQCKPKFNHPSLPLGDKTRLKRILEISGFSSKSSFIYVFRKITGTTPKKFREQYYVTEQ